MQDIRVEKVQVEQLNSPAVTLAPKKDTLITPERVEGLLSFVAQLNVFADGGKSSTWLSLIHI